MRTFLLVRDEDVSGVSGVGTVAEGVQFASGKCALAWTTRYRSVAVYDSISDLRAIHEHGGKTRVVWTSDLVADVVSDVAMIDASGDPLNRVKKIAALSKLEQLR